MMKIKYRKHVTIGNMTAWYIIFVVWFSVYSTEVESDDPRTFTDTEWEKRLTPEQYSVTRERKTEEVLACWSLSIMATLKSNFSWKIITKIWSFLIIFSDKVVVWHLKLPNIFYKTCWRIEGTLIKFLLG